MKPRLSGIILIFIIAVLPLCTTTSEPDNESAVPTIDINISIDGKVYNIHIDRNSTKEFDRVVALIDELLRTVNQG